MTAVSFDGSKYVLADEPDGAVGVIAARGAAKDGDPIVMVGRVGGATNPWIEGRAAFTVLDASKSVVANGSESKSGEICMGDCCAIERAGCTALVKVVMKATSASCRFASVVRPCRERHGCCPWQGS